MRRLAFLVVLTAGLGLVPAAAASPTVRLTLIHVFHGCHTWGTADGQELPTARTVTIAKGGKVQVRVSCPMAFDVKQIAGPPLGLGTQRWQTGTSHTLVFKKAGVYKLKALNVQTSAELNLQTLGPDSTPLLIVRVR